MSYIYNVWVNPWLLKQYSIYTEGSEHIARGHYAQTLRLYPVLLKEPWVNLFVAQAL